MVGMLTQQMNGKIDTWDIQWGLAHTLNSAYCVFPTVSKIQNIGTDGSGVHFKSVIKKYDTELDLGTPVRLPTELHPDPRILLRFRRFFDIPVWARIKRIVYLILKAIGLK